MGKEKKQKRADILVKTLFVLLILFAFTNCKKLWYPDKNSELIFENIKKDSTLVYKFDEISDFSSIPAITKYPKNYDKSEIKFVIDSARKTFNYTTNKGKDTIYAYPKIWYYLFSPKDELNETETVEIKRPFCYGDEDCASWYYKFKFKK